MALQSDAESVEEADVLADEDSTEPDAVEDDDGLKGDSVWDPDNATPWRPNRRSRRNTSQLTVIRKPSLMQPDKVSALALCMAAGRSSHGTGRLQANSQVLPCAAWQTQCCAYLPQSPQVQCETTSQR